MVEAILIFCLLAILFILFRPRRGKYVRNVVSTRNGHSWRRDQEPY